MEAFKDLFSKQASVYRNSRPTYPQELYEFITGFCSLREIAWDCATGNGQCALALADYFDEIIATDASAQQIENAIPHTKVRYEVASAYSSGLKNASVDMITVATAAHWFEIEKFYKEADRVLKPGGVLAIWSYGGCRSGDKYINDIIKELSFDVLKDYWAPEIWQIWRDKYQFLQFPYPQIEAPVFRTDLNWNYHQIINYFNSWSGVQNYKDKLGTNPIDKIQEQLENAWGDPENKKLLTWDLYMKIGIKPLL